MGDEGEKAEELFDKLEDEREQDCEGTALNRHALVTIIATALRQVGREMRERIQESDEAYYAVGTFNDHVRAELARFRGLFGDHDEPPRTYEQSEAMWNAMKTELEQVKAVIRALNTNNLSDAVMKAVIECDALTQQLGAAAKLTADVVIPVKMELK